MSRRKQARPRHVDDPDLESPAIAPNTVVPVFEESDSEEHSVETRHSPALDVSTLDNCSPQCTEAELVLYSALLIAAAAETAATSPVANHVSA
ncbi:hypothetical protein DPMN_140422 [Dreissena polymorpha]|uniref:Uncharacterized protein n=1 Tax=Dreissena polymorpha TaxID=45954 RepID=A0A9D4JGN4_DREPO|nr:hypothetical protein DPMN_140422 [Dreissena polymorpha]